MSTEHSHGGYITGLFKNYPRYIKRHREYPMYLGINCIYVYRISSTRQALRDLREDAYSSGREGDLFEGGALLARLFVVWNSTKKD